MDQHIREFYSKSSDEFSKGCFHSVIPLHDHPEIPWEIISEQCPELRKGWYELARLTPRDRIEFTRDFWLSKLPYRPSLDVFLMKFFGLLDDIGVFIVQKKFDDPHEAHLVYSLRGNSGFYRGRSALSEAQIPQVQKILSDYMLPSDYLAFLGVHNGFSKSSDCTGVTRSDELEKLYVYFQDLISQREGNVTTSSGTSINPASLIPFYESFGMPYFQCFWGEWYPENEMGNVYYSGMTNTISDIKSSASSGETMAFPTFLDWLMFYLEQVEDPR